MAGCVFPLFNFSKCIPGMLFPETLLQRLRSAGIVAGFSVDRVEHAVPIVHALHQGGIRVIELLLRTPASMQGLQAICQDLPKTDDPNGSGQSDMLVGVGTILTPQTIRDVQQAGAHFGVSPGMNPNVIRAAAEVGLPFAPGIATPSDLEAAIELDCRLVKFFPAEASGGIAYLKSMSAAYNHLGIEYFPLGGINADNMNGYLKEPSVAAVGGSWIVKKELVHQENWAAITQRATEVVAQVQQGKNV